jgi:glycosyltransferase involved in cell wall biosynthesis
MAASITACIICFNEEHNIRRCLESVTWTDEIVIMDSYSTDNTLTICKEYDARIYQHEWLGYIGQKTLIQEKAASEWIFFVDADEEVSAELREEVQRQFSSGEYRRWSGYEFPRLVRFLGKWIRHGDWHPDIKLRLFRKEQGRCTGIEPHDRVAVDGPVRRLHAPLYHYTYRNIHEQMESLNKFSTISAQELFKRKRQASPSDLLLRPMYRFFKCFILKRGIADGFHGFLIAMASSYGTFTKYVKLWEMNRRHGEDAS